MSNVCFLASCFTFQSFQKLPPKECLLLVSSDQRPPIEIRKTEYSGAQHIVQPFVDPQLAGLKQDHSQSTGETGETLFTRREALRISSVAKATVFKNIEKQLKLSKSEWKEPSIAPQTSGPSSPFYASACSTRRMHSSIQRRKERRFGDRKTQLPRSLVAPCSKGPNGKIHPGHRVRFGKSTYNSISSFYSDIFWVTIGFGTLRKLGPTNQSNFALFFLFFHSLQTPAMSKNLSDFLKA